MTEGARPGVARRTVVAGLVAAVLPTAGCGIRLEDDAPRVPFVPTRTPVPAEAELVALTRDTAALAELAATVPGALAAVLVPLHQHQHSVLRTSLLAEQVPAAALDASSPSSSTSPPPASTTGSPSGASPSATPSSPSSSAAPTGSSSSASPTTPTAGSRTALAEAEGASAAAAGTFAGVAADLRATIASLHAQRYAAATLLVGRPPAVPLDPIAGDRVETLAAATSAAIYLLEVVAARSTGAQRARADTTLLALRGLLADQLAGGAVTDEALGHPLPFPVDDRASAAKLAREALTTLRAGYGEQLGPIVESDGAAGLAALTRWLGTVEVEAHRWGVPLAPFPGLS